LSDSSGTKANQMATCLNAATLEPKWLESK